MNRALELDYEADRFIQGKPPDLAAVPHVGGETQGQGH